MQSYIKKIIFIGIDLVCVNVGFLIALMLRFDGGIEERYFALYQQKWLSISIIMLLVFLAFNLYNNLWKYAGVREVIQLISSCALGSCTLFTFGSLEHNMFPKAEGHGLFPRSCYIIYILVIIFLMLAVRFTYKLISNSKLLSDKETNEKNIKSKKRVLLVGAGEAASIIIKDMNNKVSTKKIILAVDDDKQKFHSKINGVPVRGGTDKIKKLVNQYDIQEIIVAMPSASKKRISEILNICNTTECELKIFPGIDKSITSNEKYYIRPVKIEDLLGREEIVLDNTKLDKVLEQKTVLVTGGGGSIGSELCRQVLNFNIDRVVIFDIYENNAYDLQNELIQRGIPESKINVVIGSVRDKEKLRYVFSIYKPNIVFHAAAHKHVPLMEINPEEAIKNNVFGTINTAECAIEFGVEKFVLISTDKAVNPTNVMGATKRICEMIIQSINETTDKTDFVAVRFGNVLGSNGSVIPLFRRQLEAGGPITVTHPDIIRYFMTIPEAVRLILEATTFATGGEIFVLDMGEPVKILDMAKNFIKLSGFEVDKDIKIKITGLRPGEKLYEELLMSEEGLKQTEYEKIFIGKPGNITYGELQEKISILRDGLEVHRDVREMLSEIVPTYKAAKNDNEEAKKNKAVVV